MKNPSMFAFAQSALVLCALSAPLYGKAGVPDAGDAGVPGESSCARCHTGNGTGNVAVSFPNGLTYTPGVNQTWTVTVSDPVEKRWGFQLTARQASSTKTQAGSFMAGPDGYTQIICLNNRLDNQTLTGCDSDFYPLIYIEQTANGTQAGKSASAAYTFTWTPPRSDLGNVTIFVAGVAADNDGSASGGDITYTKQYTLTYVAPILKPSIAAGGVVNGASFQPGIAAGSWISILGTNLSHTGARSWRADEFVKGALPTQLDGVGVTVNGKPAYISYISDTQINAQAPSDAGVGSASVVVTVSGVPSSAVATRLLPSSPAFFLSGGKYAVATRPDYSVIGPATPAKPGDVVILWGTGFGATTPPVPAGVQVATAAYLTNAPSVTVGGFSAQVVGAALAPGSAGLYQVAITLPASLPDGDLEVLAMADGFPSPSGVLISIKK